MHATEAAGRTGPRGADSSVDIGPPTTGEGVGGVRHADPKIQELRNEWGRSLVGHLSEGGTGAARETSVELPSRDEGGDTRKSRGTKDEERGCPAKRKSIRKKFAACLEACGLSDHQFRPYSLRRGGATCYFSRYGSLDRLLLLGRWQAAKTARVYINEGLATLAEFRLHTNSQAQAYKRQYTRSKNLELQPLERARKGRPGESGKGKKSRRKKGKK